MRTIGGTPCVLIIANNIACPEHAEGSERVTQSRFMSAAPRTI